MFDVSKLGPLSSISLHKFRVFHLLACTSRNKNNTDDVSVASNIYAITLILLTSCGCSATGWIVTGCISQLKLRYTLKLLILLQKYRWRKGVTIAIKTTK